MFKALGISCRCLIRLSNQYFICLINNLGCINMWFFSLHEFFCLIYYFSHLLCFFNVQLWNLIIFLTLNIVKILSMCWLWCDAVFSRQIIVIHSYKLVCLCLLQYSIFSLVLKLYAFADNAANSEINFVWHFDLGSFSVLETVY